MVPACLSQLAQTPTHTDGETSQIASTTHFLTALSLRNLPLVFTHCCNHPAGRHQPTVCTITQCLISSKQTVIHSTGSCNKDKQHTHTHADSVWAGTAGSHRLTYYTPAAVTLAANLLLKVIMCECASIFSVNMLTY